MANCHKSKNVASHNSLRTNTNAATRREGAGRLKLPYSWAFASKPPFHAGFQRSQSAKSAMRLARVLSSIGLVREAASI
jgi:hypothetical protein